MTRVTAVRFRFQKRSDGLRRSPGEPRSPTIEHQRPLETQPSVRGHCGSFKTCLNQIAKFAGSRRGSVARDAALLVLLSRATGAGFVPPRMGLTVNRLDWVGQRCLVLTGQAGAVTLAAIQLRKEPSLECIHVTLPHNKYGDSRTRRAEQVERGLLQLATAVRIDRTSRLALQYIVQFILWVRHPKNVILGAYFYCPLPWHCLYFLPDPHGQG